MRASHKDMCIKIEFTGFYLDSTCWVFSIPILSSDEFTTLSMVGHAVKCVIIAISRLIKLTLSILTLNLVCNILKNVLIGCVHYIEQMDASHPAT